MSHFCEINCLLEISSVYFVITMENPVATQWAEIKALVNELELEVLKNSNGNNAAGVRARKGLRLLKTKIVSLVKTTVVEDKTRKTSKE